MSRPSQVIREKLLKSISKDLIDFSTFPGGRSAAMRAAKDLALGHQNDSVMALRMAMGAMPMTSQVIRNVYDSEWEHQRMLTRLKTDPPHVPIPLLEQMARSLCVVLAERESRPAPDGESWSVVSRLRDVALLIAKLETVSNAAHDLGVYGSRHGVDVCLVDLRRDFEEESRGRSRFESGVLKRVYERFAEDVACLHGLFWALADKQGAWDLNARHDYQGDFTLLFEAAMDAALALEANFEDRVFGPREAVEHVG